MNTFVSALIALTALSTSLCAQDSTSVGTATTRAKPAWVTSRDAAHAGLALLGIGVLSLADESVAKLMQRPALQNQPALHHAANTIQTAGDPGALITSASLYVIGSIAHKPGLADAGLHSTEAIVVSGAITNLAKVVIGRARPNISNDENAYQFHPTRGQTDYNSFPSGHATAAFAAATVFSTELRRTHPSAATVATPLVYSVATLVGASRMYNNRHWLSDVVTGALVGHFVGARITAHAHPRN